MEDHKIKAASPTEKGIFEKTPEKIDSLYNIDSYQFDLPPEQIAQTPLGRRDASKLLVLRYTKNRIEELSFRNILSLIESNDIVVVNDTRVFPARLFGKKATGGHIEALLLRYPEIINENVTDDKTNVGYREAMVEALLRASKRPRKGSTIRFSNQLEATVEFVGDEGIAKLRFQFLGDLDALLSENGKPPLPPYITSQHEDQQTRERYQTIYARATGAVAAPTAGLHFTKDLMEAMNKRGIKIIHITLHVGYGTFAPIRVKDIRLHKIHGEYVSISPSSADRINAAISSGSRLWAVGTTTTRALEFASDRHGVVSPMDGICPLYIYPGYRFKIVRNLITNFHLPGSSLLFLVSALAGRENILNAYRHAVANKYRFYSYGDAMAIIE